MSWRCRSVFRTVRRRRRKTGVEFAFPTQTLYLRQEDRDAREIAGAGYPEMSRDEGARARAAARQLVDDALGGRVPPPVEFATPPEQNGGDASE